MRKSIVYLAAAALVGTWPLAGVAQQAKKGQQQSAAKSGMSQQDAKRFRDIAEANMTEVEVGKLAESKAQSQDVKDFAKHMVDDHSRMLDEGKQLGEKKSLKAPSGPSKAHQSAKAKLEKMSGDDFDSAYVRMMVDDHQKALKLVQDTAKNAKDADLKSMAQKAAPEIEKHLQMAKSLQSAAAGRSSKK